MPSGPMSPGQRAGIRRHLQDRRPAERVQDVARQAHVNHFLQRDRLDALAGGGVGAATDRVEGVEIRRQRAELDADRRLQHRLGVVHARKATELKTDHAHPLVEPSAGQATRVTLDLSGESLALQRCSSRHALTCGRSCRHARARHSWDPRRPVRNVHRSSWPPESSADRRVR